MRGMLLTIRLFLMCLCFFAASTSPQAVKAMADTTGQRYSSPYDVVQDERMSSVEASIAEIQETSKVQQKEIESLIETQSKWTGGLQMFLGIIGLTSTVGLFIQIHEKLKKKE